MNDALLRIMTDTERQLRFAQSLQNLHFDVTSSALAKELTLASRAIAEFRMRPEFDLFAANLDQMSGMTASIGKQLALTLAPLQITATEIGKHIASQLDGHRQAMKQLGLALDQGWLRDMESIGARIAEMARVNFAIPETAVLNWSTETLSNRALLVQDCVFNVSALEAFHAVSIPTHDIASRERLAVATEFVFEHAEVVRRLPPRLPNVETGEQDRQEHRNEEIGAKLEPALRSIDPRLCELRQKAWGNVHGGVVGARLGMAGIRELFDEVLRIFAPEREVEVTPAWQNRTDKNTKRPTRKIRLAYVLGEARATEADALFQFDESIKRTQKFVHTFADDVELVRAQMAHLETWIYLLTHYGMQRSRSN